MCSSDEIYSPDAGVKSSDPANLGLDLAASKSGNRHRFAGHRSRSLRRYNRTKSKTIAEYNQPVISRQSEKVRIIGETLSYYKSL